MHPSTPERRPTRPPLTHSIRSWTRSRSARLLAGMALLAVVAIASSGTATASPRPVVASVHGIELIAHHTQGTFGGYTSGGLSAGWLAIVNHTPLNPNAHITGGSFTLITKTSGLNHPITAQINHGTITNTNPGANCTNQTYAVTGTLNHITGNHTGTFSLTLTHWRHNILGTCLAYFATTTGTLTLTR